MRREENDPLPFQQWVAQLEELSTFSAVQPYDSEEIAVCRAFHLFKLATPIIRSFSDPFLSETEFDLTLEQSGAEAAMLLIAGERARYEIEAVVSSPRYRASFAYDNKRIAYGEGNSRALAMVCAWSNWLASPY